MRRAHGQRADASDRVEGVVRRRRGAVEHRVRPDGIDQFLLAGDHAERRVVEPGNPLRGRVQRQVNAVRQRLLAERGREGRIDDGDGSAQRTQLVEIDQLEARIRRCLGQCEHGLARSQRGRKRTGLCAVDQRECRCPCVGTGPAGTRVCRRRAGAAPRCDRRWSTGRRSPWRWRPCPTRTPVRRRRLRARRSHPRTTARWGWSIGCRTRRRGSP